MSDTHDDLDDLKYLECRFPLRHSWKWGDVDDHTHDMALEQFMICDRCTTRKSYLVSYHPKTKGRIIERKGYKYPPGYLRKNKGRMTDEDREQLAELSLMRHLAEVGFDLNKIVAEVEAEKPKVTRRRRAAPKTEAKPTQAKKTVIGSKTVAHTPAAKKRAAPRKRTTVSA